MLIIIIMGKPHETWGNESLVNDINKLKGIDQWGKYGLAQILS